ncbi:aminotransferase class I/II-fold pyridoxal phosphate-dependent enzyme [Endozoicomonas sp.]|nr:aminotransferase class I/II-fold pyridoxal phosphate-dependent enzyme [Endozoicomonas sp.]
MADYLTDKLRAAGLEMENSVGGFYLFLSVEPVRDRLANRGIVTSDQLAQKLLSEEGIALLPGSDFGREPDQLYVRIAYVDFDGAMH